MKPKALSSDFKTVLEDNSHKAHTSEELNQLVEDYRNDITGAAERLLDAFAPIVNKYVKLCVQGNWDPKDYDLRKFLSMLSTTGDLQQTASYLVKLLKHNEPDDILMEARLALLTCARKYTNISVNYKFVFKRQIKDLIKDPLVNFCSQLPEEFEELENFKSVQDEEIKINSDWICGKTVELEKFERLTPLQRAVIKLIYHDGMSEEEAAKVLHLEGPKLVRKEITGIKEILKFFADDIKKALP